MKRTLSVMCAIVVGVAVSAAAQAGSTTQRKTDDSKEMTVTGCLEKTKSGGYWLVSAMPSSAAMPRGTTGTTTPTADTTTMKHGMTYNLENAKDLDKHVGHKIEVIGHVDQDTSGDQLKGTTGDREMQARDFEVKSFKMLASSCS